ncbi:hypothetical protein LAZ67_2001414 [Cordylochernes scorpioides]|uniref:Uncharacterized protein n=1 Tax=Cordylochernes scorpioides TaxID=51811 RepID=A0ABY6K2G0_9ARAC|nr:hypothetical protein LAZ67_2001414 [Cordylochernes scorpioides]
MKASNELAGRGQGKATGRSKKVQDCKRDKERFDVCRPGREVTGHRPKVRKSSYRFNFARLAERRQTACVTCRFKGRKGINKQPVEHAGLNGRKGIDKQPVEHAGLNGREGIDKQPVRYVGLKGREGIDKQPVGHVGLKGREGLDKQPVEHVGLKGREGIDKQPVEHVGLKGREGIDKQPVEHNDMDYGYERQKQDQPRTWKIERSGLKVWMSKPDELRT